MSLSTSVKFPLALTGVVSLVGIWSAVRPYDTLTWWLEASPVLIAVPLLIAIYSRFRFTNPTYFFIAVHCVILLVGAHYTYARVPLFDTFALWFDWSRNHFDRLGHFAQGAVPALVARELLLRTSPLQPGKWLFAIVFFSCLGISAVYELIEWLAAEISEEASAAFLGTQGDNWDTQKDMLMAALGAITFQLLFASTQDRELHQ